MFQIFFLDKRKKKRSAITQGPHNRNHLQALSIALHWREKEREMASLDSPNSPPNCSSFAIRETTTHHKKMASLDPPNSPPNHSFAIRESTSQSFLRSISTKETSFAGFRCSPPRYSTPTRHTSPLSSPRRSFNPNPPNHTISLDASYKCLSSVLKKDGQILSIAISNGIIYTGSDTNLIRIWKLPEFAECGVLKAKACTVVALAVSHERLFAAYGDTKIRVWRRTWNGAMKHVGNNPEDRRLCPLSGATFPVKIRW